MVVVYHGWLRPGLITSGDFPYIGTASLKDGVPIPSLWASDSLTGAYDILGAPMFPIAIVQGALTYAHMDWSVSARLLWVFPAVIVPCIGTYVLSWSLFRSRPAALVSATAAIMNSYAYLLYQGGQFGVAVAYGCMSLVLWSFIRSRRKPVMRGAIPIALIMAVQAIYDIRSTYISVGLCLLYGVCSIVRAWSASPRVTTGTMLRVIGLPQLGVAAVLLLLIHAWWILPATFVRIPALPAGYGDVAGVRGLSYLHMSNALSLFHPLWFANDLRLFPINPLFFCVPVLVFGLLIRRRDDLKVLFLLVVALIAAFLAKGDNAPYGAIYDWLFVHIPGFYLFRDPSKFCQPLALAIALLLGLAAAEVAAALLNGRRRFAGVYSVGALVFFVLVAAFPAYPALLQQGGGTFVSKAIPQEYDRFNDFVERQPQFFRILWVPQRPRFGESSGLHPSLDAAQLSACCARGPDTGRDTLSWLRAPQALSILDELAVRYIAVDDEPQDDALGQAWTGEASSATSPATTLSVLREDFPSLHESTIGRLHIFSNPSVYPLLFTTPKALRQPMSTGCTRGALCFGNLGSVSRITAVHQIAVDGLSTFTGGGSSFQVAVSNVSRPMYLIFSQTYDANWLAYVMPHRTAFPLWSTLLATPLPARDHLIANGYANAWQLRRRGTYHIILVYGPQRWEVLGWCVTAGILLCCGLVLLAPIALHGRRQRRRSAYKTSPGTLSE